MKSFYNHLSEEHELQESSEALLEKLITFGGKAYPKFGNVVIMAGGAGSGKGFVMSTLVGMEGKIFDVDELKKLASKSAAINKRVMDEFGVDLKDLSANLQDSENVSKLHDIIGSAMKLDKRKEQALYSGILTAAPDRKPNLIFDVTLKDLQKLESISRKVSSIGYEKENIHIVWVVNDIEVAKSQNTTRDRRVPAEILINTHRGAQQTMADIVGMGNRLKKYMDGDIVFAFNKVGVDAKLMKSGKGGSFVKDANYFYVKRKGKSATPIAKLDKELRAKIANYVPKGIDWV